LICLCHCAAGALAKLPRIGDRVIPPIQTLKSDQNSAIALVIAVFRSLGITF
jgi:hypothetical protein